MEKPISWVLAAVACVGAIQIARAADTPPTDRRVRLLASTCVNCHGPGGQSLGAVPSLSGLDKTYLHTAMMECKTGVRETTVMRKYMLGFTDEEIVKLAEYFANLK